MKTKKIIVAILIFAAIFMVSIFMNTADASSLGYLTITKDRTVGEITYKHQLYTNNTTSTRNVWKIVTSNPDGTITNTIPDLYCLRAGLGFTSANPNNTKIEYNQSYNMMEEYSDLVQYFSGLTSETTIFDTENKESFDAVMWILDNMLLEGASEAEVITYLKTYAGYTDNRLNISEDKENVLTRADIEAIQQLAIWYFTNSDEEEYNKETLPTIYMTITGDEFFDTEDAYKTYGDIFNILEAHGTERQTRAEALYSTLIAKAKEAAKEEYTPSREITIYLAGTDAALEQPVVRVEDKLEVDVALRKFISSVNGEELTGDNSREPVVDTTKLNKLVDGTLQTTAIYNHTKTPLKVSIEDTVTYTLRLYNEGEVDTYIKEITDYLPAYLEYTPYGEDQGTWWILDEQTGRVAATTEYCVVTGVGGNIPETEIGKTLGEVLLPAAEYDDPTDSYILSYIDVQISCKVMTTTPYDTNVTNLAQITEMTNDKQVPITEDRDSTPDGDFTLPTDPELPTYKDEESDKPYVPGQEDDDDFEKIFVETPELDLALRKFISAVGDTKYDRAPTVVSSGLKQGKETAIYNHSKVPVQVEIGDVVTYTIRLYNEGDVDARVSQVTDYTAKNLKYVSFADDKNGNWWTVEEGEKYNTLTSTENCIVVNVGGKTNKTYIGGKLSDAIIPAYNKEADVLSYVDIEVHCQVLPVTTTKKITNIAEITQQTDEYGTPIDKDRDSTPDNVKLPENFPGYKDEESNKPYVPGQEDDDDFEKVLVKPDFDLALRKFITKVGTTNVNNRYPEVSYADGKLSYKHTKDPVDVVTGDTVIYTIRVYNEGEADGYANEITDDIPEGLEFLPEHETNTTYRWKMLDENQEETEDVTKAKYIITDYLSEEQEKETERINLLKAFDKDSELTEINPDYKDVQIAFKVTYKAETKEETERTIVNTAQISKDSDDDIDSVPNRDEVYDHEDEDENEDDIDYDQVKVKYFDLSLLKWVGQTVVTLNGKTTTTNTGHTAETSKNEDAVKIEIKAKDVKKISIKYVYTIRITNEGEMEGYAKEITDYIPKGLKFVQEDNPDWYVLEDGKIATKALEDTLLKPGESAEVKVTLTWINGTDNFGEKINIAEISIDDNKSDSPDVDSTPNNEVPGEDDIDDAPVIITVKTGSTQIYIGLILIILVTFAGGVGLIKKYVLE